MIEQWIRQAIGNVWGDIAYYLTFQFLDPFWGWCAWLAALYVVVMLVCWLFGTLWPPLRWIGGVLLIGATFGLFAYAKGEAEARAHDKRKAPKPRLAESRPTSGNEPWWPFK